LTSQTGLCYPRKLVSLLSLNVFFKFEFDREKNHVEVRCSSCTTLYLIALPWVYRFFDFIVFVFSLVVIESVRARYATLESTQLHGTPPLRGPVGVGAMLSEIDMMELSTPLPAKRSCSDVWQIL
jgi:hypothetical protein